MKKNKNRKIIAKKSKNYKKQKNCGKIAELFS